MSKFKFIVGLTGLGLLTACGGADSGVGGAASFGAINQSAGLSFGSIETSATSRRVAYPVTSGRNRSVGISEARSFDRGIFKAYKSGEHMTFYADSPNGTGSAEIYAVVDDLSNTTIPAGARIDSNGGDVPTSGSANYAGEYIGFLTRDTTTSRPNLTQSFIAGDVSLTADFSKSGGQVSGSITNRERFVTSNGNYADNMADVFLGTHSISNGASAGTGLLAGGGLRNSDYVPEGGGLVGEWSVAFGGQGAVDAGGVVEIIHDYQNGGRTPDDYIETGVFAVTR